MKKIIHFHGFSSSGQCNTVKQLRRFLPNVDIISPDMPISANENIVLLKEICNKEKPDLIIGTSMGGFFAQLMRGYKKILFNPSFFVSDTLSRNIGMYEWCDPRFDGSKTFEITQQIVDEYLTIEKTQFKEINAFDIENSIALFGENDELVDCRPHFMKHYRRGFYMPGGHFPSIRAIKNYLVPHINNILDLK